MLDLPCVVVTKSVGQFDLGQRVLIKLTFIVRTPWARQLQFIKDPEFHDRFPVFPGLCLVPECASGSRPCQERSGLAARPTGNCGSIRDRPRTAAAAWLPCKAAQDTRRTRP